MVSLVSFSILVVAVFVSDAICQQPKIILPTYRPPRLRRPIIRTVREANDEHQWLWKGDTPRAPATGEHHILPKYIDDVKPDTNLRYDRSVDSPSAKRYGGGHSSGGSSRDTGATHPGYNRRNTRSIKMPDILDPLRPTLPSPYNPFGPRPGHPRGPYPIYARTARDIHIPGVQKPSHRDVIIPNWNPNVRTNPWDRLGGRRARSAVLEHEDDIFLGYGEDSYHQED